MSIPSASYYTTYTFDEGLDDHSFNENLCQRLQSIIRQQDGSNIPHLFSELAPSDFSLPDAVNQDLGPFIGSGVLVLAVILQTVRINRSITSFMLSSIRQALLQRDTLNILAVKWGYTNGRRHLLQEIAKACVHPRCSFEGVALALGIMLDPILVRFIGSIEGSSQILPSDRHPVGQSLSDPRSSPLPPYQPITEPRDAVNAHSRIQNFVNSVVRNRSSFPANFPWGRVVRYNLRSDLVHQAETVGDALWGVFVLRVLWEEREHFSVQAFKVIHQFLASNSLMAIVLPLFGVDASAAFTDSPSAKSRGDLMEAAVGLAFLDDREEGRDSDVIDTLYYILSQLVEICAEVWNHA